MRKDVVFQIVLDLRDPCIRTDLSILNLRVKVYGVPCDAYDPLQALDKQGHRDRSLRAAGLGPFTKFGRLGCRSLQPLKDSFRHQSPH
jgi:hypothetical protein